MNNTQILYKIHKISVKYVKVTLTLLGFKNIYNNIKKFIKNLTENKAKIENKRQANENK